jgi:hypothetical protein
MTVVNKVRLDHPRYDQIFMDILVLKVCGIWRPFLDDLSVAVHAVDCLCFLCIHSKASGYNFVQFIPLERCKSMVSN